MANTAFSPANSVTPTTAATFIPEIWSDEIIAAYKKNLVLFLDVSHMVLVRLHLVHPDAERLLVGQIQQLRPIPIVGTTGHILCGGVFNGDTIGLCHFTFSPR